MKRQEYFFTAQPVATDDDGHLGYLWQGIVYTERDFDMGYFNPFIKTDNLFYTPDEAIDEAKQMVSHQILEEQGPINPSFIDKSKIMDVGDENVFEKWREEMLKELEKDPNYMNPQDDFEQIMKNRLMRCKTCQSPNDPVKGLCPGNLGLGCIGDWRCCDEMSHVCKSCNICDDYMYCEHINCESMNEYRIK